MSDFNFAVNSLFILKYNVTLFRVLHMSSHPVKSNASHQFFPLTVEHQKQARLVTSYAQKSP